MQLSIAAAVPLWQGDTVVDDNIPNRLTSYSHDISVDGGYSKAKIGLAANINDVEEWIEHGIGRDINVKNAGLETIWEGFVDMVEATIGPLSITVGPLLDVITRCRVDYKTISYNTNPPIGGDPATTGFADNLTSQKRYGVLESLASAGESTEQQARQIQRIYLNEWSRPSTTQRISLGDPGSVSLMISCSGYHRLLDRYYIERTSETGLQKASEKIGDALSQDPNNLFNGISSIEENGTLVGIAEDGGRTAWSVIKELVSLGDAGGNRYIFGIYKDRKAKYSKVPDDYEYSINVKQPPQMVKDRAGSMVEYWDVKPGRWLVMNDMLVGSGRTPITSEMLTRDRRAIFIESVGFSAPNTLSVNGGKVGTLSQVLARQGLGGI